MIKTFGLLDKRADITQDQFHAHWRGPHADDAVKLVPVMRRYVQNHKAARNYPGFDAPCDGAPEVWLDDMAAAATLGTMPEYMNGAYIDEPNFMRARSGGVIVQEQVALDTSIARDAVLTKVLFFVKRSTAFSHDAFVAQWLAREQPLFTGGGHLLRWVRSPRFAGAYPDGGSAYDGVEELWWAADAAYEKDAGADPDPLVDRLVDRAATTAMFVDENRVVWD